MAYQKGEKIVTKYTNPPVSKEDQYPVGEMVDISDAETNKRLAVFRVDSTDETEVRGTIVKVLKIGNDPRNRNTQPDPRRAKPT